MSPCTLNPGTDDDSYQTIVVGAGGAGLAAISMCPTPALWIDPRWEGGRLAQFSTVPSNTRVALFRKVHSLALVSGRFLSNHPGETDLPESLDDDQGCPLRHAAKLIERLSRRIRPGSGIHCHWGVVQTMTQRLDGTWLVHCSHNLGTRPDDVPGDIDTLQTFVGKQVILATGAQPKSPPRIYPGLEIINPEDLLSPEHLNVLDIGEVSRIAVIGSSHSAILVLRTLLTNTRCALVVNVFREPLCYAEYLSDGRIRHDNTGLKGEAAAWARLHVPVEEGVRDRLLKVRADTMAAETAIARCSHIVWAIGYERVRLPTIVSERPEGDRVPPGTTASVLVVSGHDEQQRLLDTRGRVIPNLRGLGIAFPERVIDVSGRSESAVGLYKFMRTAEHMLVRKS